MGTYWLIVTTSLPQEDMNKQGVKTTQKGVCAACSKPIVGQVITALGHTWHPEHFTCSHCNQELGTQNFFEREGRPYCEQDYHLLFSPRCGYCQGPILDKCISALDQTFHPEHFFCSDCGRQFGDEGFHEKDDAAYCKTCYFEQFAPKCGGCNTPITENYISSLNLQWHPNCFVCKECQHPFQDGNFFEHEGFPYCEQHYHALRGSLCAGCHKAISGRCITAMFRKFHPEHFVCSFCLKQLNKGTFKEQGEKPYCHECFDRLFGWRSSLLCCTVLYCTVLYWTALYFTVPYCTVPYCTVLYCTVLYCTVLYDTVLYCTVLYCTVLYCILLCCAVFYCNLMYRTVLRRTLLYCTVLYYTAYCTILCCTIQHYTVLYCTIYTILYCIILQCTVVTPHHVVLYCTIQYYTVPYSTILYHTLLNFTIHYYTVPHITILFHTVLNCTIHYYTVPYITMLYHIVIYCTLL